jgi:hypothetical protein
MQPAHDGLRMTAGAFGDPGGAGALGDLVQGEETLAHAGMRGGQGQAAQVGRRLPPTLVVNA